MLRLLSSKIFREDLQEFALPMFAFHDFGDVKCKMVMDSGTYKFCLPVSVGDFAETNVPACFSNDERTLHLFVDDQKTKNHRKAFIISDFGVSDLDSICFSGTIHVCSKRGLYDYYNRETVVSMTLKNPIRMYGENGISPRDLPPDIELCYDHVLNTSAVFPRVKTKCAGFDLSRYQSVLYQAYQASVKLHAVSEVYDGLEYSNYALFFVDVAGHVWLYEVIGEAAFLRKEKYDPVMLARELDVLKQ